MGGRHALAFLGFIGFVLSYTIRCNLSIAIVAMVSSTRNVSASTEDAASCPSDSPAINLTATATTSHSKHEDAGEFSWTEAEQGFILGSFFWGYILTQIPGGWLGHKFGGKWPFGVGLLITGIFSILTPVLTREGGIVALVLVRIVQGCAGGVTLPCMHAIIAKWIQPDERGQFSSIIYAGMPVGTAVSLLSSGYLIQHFGWETVFYVNGVVAVIWFAAWSFFVHSEPAEDPRISKVELKYIENLKGRVDEGRLEGDTKGTTPAPPPWRKIFKSSQFWAIAICQIGETWGLYTIMTELPTYMKTVLHFNIQENSLISSIPHILTFITSISFSSLGDWVVRRGLASRTCSRKVCNSVGMWGAAAALLGVAFSGCSKILTVVLLCGGVAATGGIYGGVLINLIDIAPSYAGLLMGITNTGATIPGIVAPILTGFIINGNPSLERWRVVFIITAGIYFVGNLIFVMYSNAEEQEWAKIGRNGNVKEKENVLENSPVFFTAPLEDTLAIADVNINSSGKYVST